jgi:hypothetical protein
VPPSTDFIRALEHHRVHTMANRTPTPERPSLPLLLSWIHHDNMLEGCPYNTAEIAQALKGQDEDVDRYLVPLMEQIRRYRNAIDFVWNKAHKRISSSASLNLPMTNSMMRAIRSESRPSFTIASCMRTRFAAIREPRPDSLPTYSYCHGAIHPRSFLLISEMHIIKHSTIRSPMRSLRYFQTLFTY